MRLMDLYRLAIQEGMTADPRRGPELDRFLERAKEEYAGSSESEREMLDADALWNPYADSRIVFGDSDTEVRSVMWGIDVNTPELLLADRLRERGREVDAIIGHHPRGRASANLHQVVQMQEELMEGWGVPITTAECIVGPRVHEIMCGTHAGNHTQVGDAAALLEMPFMCLHSPADLLGQRFMVNYLEEAAPERLGDLVDALLKLPEYRSTAKEGNPPAIFVGDKNKRVGKIAVKFAGGTSGPKEAYEHLSRAGIGTVVCMHVPQAHIEEAKKHHISIIVASHMASDSLGTNLIADRFEASGVEVIPFSGFIRVRRK